MRVSAETARVLITVKTTPMPSTKYGDTVCVAGVRLDTDTPSWVRLYPIAFRWLDTEAQFHKYDIVEAEIRRRDEDSRPESYSPTEDSIKVLDNVQGWPAREKLLKHLPRTSTCALRAEAGKRHDAPSLGMIEVASLDGVSFEDHDGWNDAERAKIAASVNLSQPSLFGSRTAPPKLIAPRLKFSYQYHCMDSTCRGHTGQLLDWELTEFQRRLRGRSVEEMKAEISKKFRDMMFATKRRTHLFMGNFEDAKKRGIFSVLGVYYPQRAAPTLFDLDDD